MPINNTHPEYDRHIGAVCKTHDAFEGDVQEYVPKKESQTSAQYEVFRSRASYYNVVERTTMALVGALTRKPATISGVWGDDPVFEGADTSEEFIQGAYCELMTGGRVGLLCDYDEVKQAPYICMYPSETIINWSDKFIILQESFYGADAKDPYKTSLQYKYRELYLDADGLYAVRVWGETAKDVWEVVEGPYLPEARGTRLDHIPFYCVTPYDVKMCMVRPPLNTLANINIEHFTLQCQLAHIAWVLSSPTPVIVGQLADDTTGIGLGGDKFIHLMNGGDAKYMEFSGAGSTFVLDQSKQKEEQMFSLGSRLLQYKAGVESSDALQIRLGAEGASLTTMANSLERGLEKVLKDYNSWWSAAQGELDVDLNKDFTPAQMSPDSIRILLEMYSKEVITLETLMKRLYEGEMVDDAEEEIANLALAGADPAVTLMTPPGAPKIVPQEQDAGNDTQE